MDINDVSGEIIGAAIEVHKSLGPGLLESIYEECLCIELERRKIPYERQKEIEIKYKNIKLDSKYRLDIVVRNMIIVELKVCDQLLPIHEAQLLTYLKLTGIKIGLLINFNVSVLKEGIKRLAYSKNYTEGMSFLSNRRLPI
jgi:GxxExxY protein